MACGLRQTPEWLILPESLAWNCGPAAGGLEPAAAAYIIILPTPGD